MTLLIIDMDFLYQFNMGLIAPFFTVSFHEKFEKKKFFKIFKSWQVWDWLAKWIIMLRFMDLRWPRVFRRSNVGLVYSLTLMRVAVFALRFQNLPARNSSLKIFSCDQAALWMVQSVCPSVTPFWLCSYQRIIMKFSGVITNDESDVHAKGQGQRSRSRPNLTVSGL